MSPAIEGFWGHNDISMHLDPVTGVKPIPNTLDGLTRPEYRFAHQALQAGKKPTGGWATGMVPSFPSHPHFGSNWGNLGTGKRH